MSIDTKHHLTPYSNKHNLSTRISFEEILKDFESLEDLAATVELPNSQVGIEPETFVKEDCGKYLHLQDFRRPKVQERQSVNKFCKLNKVYSLKEIKENGLQLKSISKVTSQQKTFPQSLILSEFIL